MPPPDFQLVPVVEGARKKRRKGMGSHQSKRLVEDEYLSPPDIVTALGPFDLDPCAPLKRPWPTAKVHYTVEDNGLIKRWHGRVWCNPPYGPQIGRWLARCAEHGNCTALIYARTETEAWHDFVWDKAHTILFPRGRLWFYTTEGKKHRWDGGAPSALVAYDRENAARLMLSGIPGKYVTLH